MLSFNIHSECIFMFFHHNIKSALECADMYHNTEYFICVNILTQHEYSSILYKGKTKLIIWKNISLTTGKLSIYYEQYQKFSNIFFMVFLEWTI